MKHTLLIVPMLAITGFFAPSAQAETEASAIVRSYDDGATQVLSPAIEVGSTFNEDRMKLTGHYAQDIVTSASSEVKTFGSKPNLQSQITELRNEYQFNFESQIPDGTFSAGVVVSDEKDYHSKVVSAGGTREFFSKNTVVAFGLSSGQDQIEATANSTFKESMQHQLYSISISQILSRVSLLQLIYDFRVENGFIASPYRRAKVVTNSGTIIGVAENHPRTRNRNAIGVKYNYYYNPWKTSFASTYRIYQDSWDVLSHTLEERITTEFGRKLEVAFSFRYYTQQKAKFYKDYYEGDPGVFFSGNNTLATYDSFALGLRPAYAITDKWNFSIKLEYFAQTFKDATDAGQLSTRADDKTLSISAFVIGAGLTAKF